ncbi:MAG: Lrp/AsnC family transcriptional regulator, partial [Chloroflexi bacterium]|nr:Lrp/AsnC family transcriptional regulator [Chloroflexota bacterium]
GVRDFILLPALRVFKIGVRLNMQENEPADAAGASEAEAVARQTTALSPTDVQLVRALQKDLPIEPRPFAAMAGGLGIGEEELLAGAHSLLDRGVMRRFAAVLRHRRAGFSANAMGAWVVPEADIERVGGIMAGIPEVTHCYQRPRYPGWPYDLFTMIHGRSKEECEAVAGRISGMTGIDDYRLLYSTREYKKTRVQYFEEAEDADH